MLPISFRRLFRSARPAAGEYCILNVGPGNHYLKEDTSTLPGDPTEWNTSASPTNPVSSTSGTDVTGQDFYNYKFAPGEYRTYSQGGYGGSGAPGQYLQSKFATAFPTGLVVPRATAGTTNDITLLNATQVQQFQRATNSSRFSNPNVTNYLPSVLEKQFVVLTLSVAFVACDPNFGSSTSLLGSLMLCNLTGSLAAANGQTISNLLTQVYNFLDGSVSYTLGLSASDLNTLLNNINLWFDNGLVTTWAEMHLC